jgi:hypothetical protein
MGTSLEVGIGKLCRAQEGDGHLNRAIPFDGNDRKIRILQEWMEGLQGTPNMHAVNGDPGGRGGGGWGEGNLGNT